MKQKEFVIEIPSGHEIDREKSTFERIVFKEVKKEITERVKSVEDAIRELGENDSDVQDYKKLQSAGVSEHIIGYQGAVLFVKALNEGWKSNWSNTNEYKYYIWWDMTNKALSLGSFGSCDDGSGISSRLFFKTRELALHASNYPEVFESYMRG